MLYRVVTDQQIEEGGGSEELAQTIASFHLQALRAQQWLQAAPPAFPGRASARTPHM